MLPQYDDSEWSDDEMRGTLARAAKDIGWDDPEMKMYGCEVGSESAS